MTQTAASDTVYTYTEDGWDPENIGTWYFATTVDACLGYGVGGMLWSEYRTIWTEAEPELHPDEDRRDACQWWFDVLKPIHDAKCEVAEAIPSTIDGAKELLGLKEGDDILVRMYYADDFETEAREARKVLDAIESVRASR